MNILSMKAWLFIVFLIGLLVIGAVFFLAPTHDVYAQSTSFSENPLGDGQLVPCDGTPENPCGVCQLKILAQNIINFLVYLAVIVAVLMFVYAGFLYVTGAANPGNIEKAHKIFWAVFMGLFITLASWLIVDTIMKSFYVGEMTNPSGFGPWNEIVCVSAPAENGGADDGSSDDGVVVVPPPPPPPSSQTFDQAYAAALVSATITEQDDAARRNREVSFVFDTSVFRSQSYLTSLGGGSLQSSAQRRAQTEASSDCQSSGGVNIGSGGGSFGNPTSNTTRIVCAVPSSSPQVSSQFCFVREARLVGFCSSLIPSATECLPDQSSCQNAEAESPCTVISSCAPAP